MSVAGMPPILWLSARDVSRKIAESGSVLWQSGYGTGGGSSRQLPHHTSPGIWCSPMPM